MRKTQNSIAPLIEAFASLSRKAAGSQGSALSRPSQRAESPFDSRCPARESIKQKNNRAPQSAKYSLRARRAHGGTRPQRTVSPFTRTLSPMWDEVYFCSVHGFTDFVLHVGRSRGKPIRQVGLHERPLAAGELRGCGRAFYFLFGSFSPRRK